MRLGKDLRSLSSSLSEETAKESQPALVEKSGVGISFDDTGEPSNCVQRSLLVEV